MGTEDQIEYDVDAATTYKTDHEAKMKEKEEQANALTGKDNKKARTELSKEVSAMKAETMYVDACKVVKGLAPPKGNFIKSIVEGDKGKPTQTASEAPEAGEKKDEKTDAKRKDDKPKKNESAGLGKVERDELEQLKKDII